MTTKFEQKYTVVWLIVMAVFSWSLASASQDAHEGMEEGSAAKSKSMNDLDTDAEPLPIRGARLKHTASYISSPLTVVSEKVDREAGLADAARVFQEATQYQKLITVTVYGGSVAENKTERTTSNKIAPAQVIDAKRERALGSLDMKDVFPQLN